MKRFNVIWTPTTGADNYRIRTPSTSANNAVKIHSAKMIVEQTAATATKIYIPLAGGDAIGESSSDTTGAAISTATGTPGATFSQPVASNYYPWLRTDSSYDAIASGNAWTLETITGTSNALNTASAALFDKLNNQQITGALTTTTIKTTPTFNQVSFASTATNFNDGDTMELRIKGSNTLYTTYLYKAGLWLKLKFLKKTEIPFRLVNRRAVASSAALADGRFLWDAGAWSNAAVFFKVAAIRPSGTSTITLQDHANSDTGTTTPTTPIVVAGSTVTPATTYGTQTMGPLTLTDMNRYFIQHNATATSQILGGAFLIIQAHD